MERKAVNLGGGYRLAVMDERNWKLQRWREADMSRPGAKRPGARWFDTGNFFQGLGPALMFVFERRLSEEGVGDESLSDLARRCEEIRAELLAVR